MTTTTLLQVLRCKIIYPLRLSGLKPNLVLITLINQEIHNSNSIHLNLIEIMRIVALWHNSKKSSTQDTLVSAVLYRNTTSRVTTGFRIFLKVYQTLVNMFHSRARRALSTTFGQELPSPIKYSVK